MPQYIATLKINEQYYEPKIGGHKLRGEWKWTMSHNGGGSGRQPEPTKIPDVFTVYTSAEIDKKLQDASAKIDQALKTQIDALTKKLPVDVKNQLDPQIKALFDSFYQAKAELTKAVIEDVRNDLRRTVEEEVRKILPTLL